MPAPGPESLSLDDALALTHTGDLWLFRGSKAADRVIHAATRSPVNHVGMTIALDGLPPLMWHAELGAGLADVWTGTHHRGAQLHRIDEAVRRWQDRYGQQAWLRPLHPPVTASMEASLLRSVAKLNGLAFPSPLSLAWRWTRGRFRHKASAEAIYCAELVAAGYAEMGLLDPDRPVNWYDPGRFWSGADLALLGPAELGEEVLIVLPPGEGGTDGGETPPAGSRISRSLARLRRR